MPPSRLYPNVEGPRGLIGPVGPTGANGATFELGPIQLLGSPLLALPLCLPYGGATTNLSVAAGNVVITAVYLPAAATITGVAWRCVTAAGTTVVTTNTVALYSQNNGTLTKVAESTGSATTFSSQATANTMCKTAFSSPYAADAGVYFVTLLNNGTGSALSIARATSMTASDGGSPGLTNSNKLFGTFAAASQAATVGATSITASTANWAWLALY